ncbi:MAG: hypothetical protein V7629_13295 [Motiliproteus sp.]
MSKSGGHLAVVNINQQQHRSVERFSRAGPEQATALNFCAVDDAPSAKIS